MSTRRRRGARLVMTSLLSLSVCVVHSEASKAATATPVTAGLNYPAMFTVAPDGRFFYSELRTGRIGIFNPADGSDSTYFQVPDLCASTSNDQGLYGLALPPNSPEVGSVVYAYATRRSADGSCHSQVLRLTRSATGQVQMAVLFSDPYVQGHIGGRLLFGPDGDLYISTGDGSSGFETLDQAKAQRAKAQDPASYKGKILRMTATGGVDPANLWGNYVFAYGFRNVFGFDFDPATGRLWATDNGPEAGYTEARGPGPFGGCNDEINLVVNGSNYGWGATGSCAKPPEAPFNSNQDGPSPVLPSLNIEAASGITGARFCIGCGMGPTFEGRLFYVRYGYIDGTGEIRAVTLNADRSAVVPGSDVVVLRVPTASPLSIERGPDGTLYYSDSNGIHRLSEPTTTTTTPPSTTPTTTPQPPTTTTTTTPPPSGFLRGQTAYGPGSATAAPAGTTPTVTASATGANPALAYMFVSGKNNCTTDVRLIQWSGWNVLPDAAGNIAPVTGVIQDGGGAPRPSGVYDICFMAANETTATAPVSFTLNSG